MGNICKCLRYYLCCCETKKDRSPVTHPKEKSPSGSQKVDFQVDIKDEKEEKTLISEDKLAKELLKAFKGGDTSYSSLRKRAQHRKHLQEEELKIVRKFSNRYDFDVLCLCGTGNYAEVYKVYSLVNKRAFAIKVMNNARIGNNYKLNFLPNELKILKTMVKHPNIIKVYRVKEMYDRIWIVMEYAERASMTDYLRDNGALTEDLALVFFPQILNGINELHNKNIAHRDLKLENILLSKNLIPKISDFSYAIEVDPKRPLNKQYCGSLPYLAPEIMKRLPYNPLISDIWSLGVCFFILLNDGLPFTLDDEKLMLENQLKKNWSFRNKVKDKLSPEIKTIVILMLDPNTNLRPNAKNLKFNSWFAANKT